MKKKIFNRLRWQIVGLTLGVAIAPLVLLGGAIYNQFYRAHEARIIDQIKPLASSQSLFAEVFLRERTTLLAMLAETHTYEQLSRQQALSELFSAMNLRSDMLGLMDLGVIDEDGHQVAYVGPFNLQGLNYEKEPWFNEVMTKGKYISDVYMGFRRLPHFIIAVRGISGQQSWILRATIDSDVFNRLVRTAQSGRMGDAFIINEEGIYQTTPRYQGYVLDQSGIEPVHFSRGIASVEKKTVDGMAHYFAGAWLHNKNWLLVIRQQADDEASGLIQARNTEILIISMGIMAIVLATIFTAHRVVYHLQAANQEMDALNAQLMHADKLAAMGKMATGIAHEINNPLAVIAEKAGWMKDLLEEELKGSPHLQEFVASLQKIEEHVERARRITHNMLGFARRMEPRLDDVDVNQVVDQTLELMASHARTNNIEIHKHYYTALPIIASDQLQLQQVVLNLTNNAIDAVGADGCIEVSTEMADSHIVIHVKDDGPGIPRDKQRLIFDPFFTTKSHGHGTGLGLSISYSIIQKMGGMLKFRSEPGQGTIFSIFLPLVLPERN